MVRYCCLSFLKSEPTQATPLLSFITDLDTSGQLASRKRLSLRRSRGSYIVTADGSPAAATGLSAAADDQMGGSIAANGRSSARNSIMSEMLRDLYEDSDDTASYYANGNVVDAEKNRHRQLQNTTVCRVGHGRWLSGELLLLLMMLPVCGSLVQ